MDERNQRSNIMGIRTNRAAVTRIDIDIYIVSVRRTGTDQILCHEGILPMGKVVAFLNFHSS